MAEEGIILATDGTPLYNGWKEEHMRVWVGVHPGELDDQRVLAQHSELHMLMGTIRQELYKLAKIMTDEIGEKAFMEGFISGDLELPVQNITHQLCLGWVDVRGIGSLTYLHDLVAGRVFNQRGFTHNSPLYIDRIVAGMVGDGRMAISYLFQDGHAPAGIGVPKNWPPRWITPEQRIADLKDLQFRWKEERKLKWLNLSYERYGEYSGGQAKHITDASTVTQEEVEYFKDRRAAYMFAKSEGSVK